MTEVATSPAGPRAGSDAVIVGIMDRQGWDARTDNLVLVEPSRRRLLWVPRDLWCRAVGGRINEAFARGGAELLHRALAEYGLAATGVLCLQRSATERVLGTLRVRVPVPERLEYLFQLRPTDFIEDGHRIVTFGPGDDWLEGDRIHAWLCARYTHQGTQSDLVRLERQKTFLRRLMEDGVDFRAFLARPEEVSLSGAGVIEALAQVRPDWTFETFGPVEDAVRGGRMVLMPPSRSRVGRLARRAHFGLWRRWRVVRNRFTGMAPEVKEPRE